MHPRRHEATFTYISFTDINLYQPNISSVTLSMMSSSTSYGLSLSLVVLFLAGQQYMSALAPHLHPDFNITFGDHRAKSINGGQLWSLSLDKVSGSGFRSRKDYLFGKIDMQLMLVRGNSDGPVTAYYLTSQGPAHDEIDFEFLGGKGNREQQFRLWFDATKIFHTYSIIWNPHNIIFLVDSIPIRVFTNSESRGVPFPTKQPMRIYYSLWNALMTGQLEAAELKLIGPRRLSEPGIRSLKPMLMCGLLAPLLVAVSPHMMRSQITH